jgi:hypothetical protein
MRTRPTRHNPYLFDQEYDGSVRLSIRFSSAEASLIEQAAGDTQLMVWLRPTINDTAHQVGTSTSVFKAGSTVPVKLQLKKSNGTVVAANTAPVWLSPVKGSALNVPVDEAAYTASADSGSTYRYDAVHLQLEDAEHRRQNYYRIGVILDDGQSYYVNIGLRN